MKIKNDRACRATTTEGKKELLAQRFFMMEPLARGIKISTDLYFLP